MKKGRAVRKRPISDQEVALTCSSKLSSDSSSSSSSSEHDSSSGSDSEDSSRMGEARPLVDDRYKDELHSLYKDHQKMYSYWNLLMSNNFNIILHGVGSKRQLVEEYRNHSL